jgi:2-polyprenyl-6-hydroxyphenyl methylase/3-demethylubiquinone-9 3-methyltransferase
MPLRAFIQLEATVAKATPRQVAPPQEPSVRTEYEWTSGAHAHNHQFLLPTLEQILGTGKGEALIDLGCGNGSLTAVIARHGYEVVGLDVAGSGVQQAQLAYPNLDFRAHDVTRPLPQDLRQRFQIALSAEVIEHLFLPRDLFARADEALTADGRLIVTTPYHGYLKNLALAVTNKFDSHWAPGWDYGHIKFFSRATLLKLAADSGYSLERFYHVGRTPLLAMSMIGVFKKVK